MTLGRLSPYSTRSSTNGVARVCCALGTRSGSPCRRVGPSTIVGSPHPVFSRCHASTSRDDWPVRTLLLERVGTSHRWLRLILCLLDPFRRQYLRCRTCTRTRQSSISRMYGRRCWPVHSNRRHGFGRAAGSTRSFRRDRHRASRLRSAERIAFGQAGAEGDFFGRCKRARLPS